MRIKKGFKIENLSGNSTVGSDDPEFNSTIVLSDTALFLWKMLEEKDTSKAEMLNGLLDNFEISTVLALNDIDDFLRTMKKYGIIEE